jgi:hypothetical protein
MKYSRRFGCAFLGGDEGYHLLKFLFMVSLKTLSVAQIMQHQMGGIIMNDDLKRIWKEAESQPSHGVTDKITKNFSQCPN